MTVAHNKIPKYAYQNNLAQKNGENIKKLLVEYEEDEIHPLVEQESGKHGMYGLGISSSTEIKVWRTLKIVFGQYQDKIVYFPGGKAKPYDIEQLKQYVGTPHYPTFYYDLVYIHDNKEDLFIEEIVFLIQHSKIMVNFIMMQQIRLGFGNMRDCLFGKTLLNLQTNYLSQKERILI